MIAIRLMEKCVPSAVRESRGAAGGCRKSDLDSCVTVQWANCRVRQRGSQGAEWRGTRAESVRKGELRALEMFLLGVYICFLGGGRGWYILGLEKKLANSETSW